MNPYVCTAIESRFPDLQLTNFSPSDVLSQCNSAERILRFFTVNPPQAVSQKSFFELRKKQFAISFNLLLQYLR